jgi:hypothetical protein
MQIIFLIISLILSGLIFYSIGKKVYHTHKQFLKALKYNEDLQAIQLMCIIILTLLFFITLCACNNTFWHLHYLNT